MLEDKNISPYATVYRHFNYADHHDLGCQIEEVGRWAIARNITAEGGATSYTQASKLQEEVQEFIDAETEEEAKLEFGDMLVCLINVARLRGLDMGECLELAFEKIEHRKGRMISGKFVKET